MSSSSSNHRVVKEYYSNGSLKKEIHLLDGKLHGSLIEYYQNGSIEWYSRTMINVLKSGIQRWYNSNGTFRVGV